MLEKSICLFANGRNFNIALSYRLGDTVARVDMAYTVSLNDLDIVKNTTKRDALDAYKALIMAIALKSDG
jgi:hypothetical protein